MQLRRFAFVIKGGRFRRDLPLSFWSPVVVTTRIESGSIKRWTLSTGSIDLRVLPTAGLAVRTPWPESGQHAMTFLLRCTPQTGRWAAERDISVTPKCLPRPIRILW